jgi:RNA polymerase sigma-70 factor (ECF subfamily)
MFAPVPLPGDPSPAPPPTRPTFEAVYAVGFTHVWHTLRRFGVREADLEDAAHEVFVVVHRRLDTYLPDRPLKPWLSGIAFRVASDERRRLRLRPETTQVADLETRPSGTPGPEEQLSQAQQRAFVLRALDALPLDRRSVFVMSELDEISGPDIAEALSLPLNTVYSRLRLARQDFAEAVRRLRAREGDR